jgi:hypothetical protein
MDDIATTITRDDMKAAGIDTDRVSRVSEQSEMWCVYTPDHSVRITFGARPDPYPGWRYMIEWRYMTESGDSHISDWNWEDSGYFEPEDLSALLAYVAETIKEKG